LDLDEVIKEHEFGLKSMIPDPEVFAKCCGECYGSTSVPAPRSTSTTDTIRHLRTFRDLRVTPHCPVMPDPACGTDI